MNTLMLNRETAHLNFNSIANHSNWRELCVDKRTNSDIFFNVDLVPLDQLFGFNSDNVVITGSEKNDAAILTTNQEQAVLDLDANHLIKVHGKDYTLIKNQTAFDMVNEAINKLAYAGQINTDGMFIKDSVVNKGGKTIRDYIFPEHCFSINEDDTLMKITIVNSYDGSANFSIRVGGFRVICLNGMVTGSNFANLTKRHSGEVNLIDIEKRIISSVASFKTMGEYWEQLIKTPIDNKQADAVLADFCTTDKKVSLPKFNMMNELFDSHKRSTGKNWWSLYNSLTAWATHYEVQERNIANKADVILRREREVESLLRSKVWTPKINA